MAVANVVLVLWWSGTGNFGLDSKFFKLMLTPDPLVRCSPANSDRSLGKTPCRKLPGLLLKAFYLSYHNKETILFTIDPYYGNLNYIP